MRRGLSLSFRRHRCRYSKFPPQGAVHHALSTLELAIAPATVPISVHVGPLRRTHRRSPHDARHVRGVVDRRRGRRPPTRNRGSCRKRRLRGRSHSLAPATPACYRASTCRAGVTECTLEPRGARAHSTANAGARRSTRDSPTRSSEFELGRTTPAAAAADVDVEPTISARLSRAARLDQPVLPRGPRRR